MAAGSTRREHGLSGSRDDKIIIMKPDTTHTDTTHTTHDTTHNLRLKRLLANAKLKQPAALEDIDYKHPPEA